MTDEQTAAPLYVEVGKSMPWVAQLREAGWVSPDGQLEDVIKLACERLGADRSNIRIQAVPGSVLSADEVLELIEANGGPIGLDLSHCSVSGDLDEDVIRRTRDAYYDRTGREPPWYSPYTRGLSLHRAVLRGALLQYVRLTGADMILATMEGAMLNDVRFRRARFFRTRLEGAYLVDADLEGVDLYQVPSLRGVHWSGARLSGTLMRRDQLDDNIAEETAARVLSSPVAYRIAGDTYLRLKNNFNSIGRYRDAAWAHIKEQRMERAALRCQLAWRNWRSPAFLQTVGSWVFNWALDVLAGYGETPQKPIGLGVLLAAVFFPLLYWATGALAGHGRAFTSSSPSDIDWAGWGDSLVFSLTSFATLSFTRLQPEGTVGNLIAAFEAMIGVLLFALFVFTLGTRMSRS